VAEYQINAEPRTVTGKKVKQLRHNGYVPIIVYGYGTEPVPLQTPYRALEIALQKAGGTNLIDIKVNGDTYTVLAREVQREVIRGNILHVDFLSIDMTKPITADIPVHFVGESPVVAARRGILLTGPNSLSLEMMPTKILNRIEVDLSSLLEIGDGIYVRDLDLGDEVTIHNDPDEMLARVSQTSAARAELLGEEGEEDVEALDEEIDESAEPEVISKGKQDEDEE